MFPPGGEKRSGTRRCVVRGSSQTRGAAAEARHSSPASGSARPPPLPRLFPRTAAPGAFQIKCLLMRPAGVSSEHAVNPTPRWLECFPISSGLSSAKTWLRVLISALAFLLEQVMNAGAARDSVTAERAPEMRASPGFASGGRRAWPGHSG